MKSCEKKIDDFFEIIEKKKNDLKKELYQKFELYCMIFLNL